VRLLNSDLEKLAVLDSNQPGAQSSTALVPRANRVVKANPVTQKLKDWVIPPMFRSAYDVMRDPIIADYWKDIRAGGLTVFTSIEHYEKSKLVSAIAWRSELANTLANLLDYKFGFPARLTKILLMLSKEEDFWEINHALKAWFDRHGPKQEGHLAPRKQTFLALPDDRGLEPSPQVAPAKVIGTDQLVAEKSSNPQGTIDSARLMSVPKKASFAASPESLFSTTVKRKGRTKVAHELLFGADEREEEQLQQATPL
jgi:hypothetical protein